MTEKNKVAAYVTPAEAKRLAAAFTMGEKPDASEPTRYGILPGTTGHYLFPSSISNLMRHGAICQVRLSQSLPPHWCAYMSLLNKTRRLYALSELLLDRESTYFGPGGKACILPRKIKAIQEVILPAELEYVGFDWAQVTEQPTQADLESGMQALAKRFDEIGA